MYVISFRQRSMSSSYRQFGSVGLAGVYTFGFYYRMKLR